MSLEEIYKGYGITVNCIQSEDTGKILYEAEITFEGNIIHTDYYEDNPVIAGYLVYIESVLHKKKQEQREEKLKRLGL